MGLFNKIKKAIKKAAKVVKKVINKAVDAVADAIKSIGNIIGDALNWLGKKIPGVGFIFRWLGDVISSAFDLISSILSAIGSIIGGIISGLIRIIGGIVTLDWDNIVGGLGDIFNGIFGGLILVLGKVVALVQVIFTVGRPRRLNQIELTLIKAVFHDSIATYNLRVVDGNAGLYSLNNRPFVLGDTIYIKNYSASSNPEVFAHECIHVWQNQHVGAAYLGESLTSQWWGAGYNWESEINAGKVWVDFEREAQGEFFQDVYQFGGLTSGTLGGGTFFTEPNPSLRVFNSPTTGSNFTGLANDATAVVRGAVPWRLSEIGD